jgi:hypothetical protein
MEIRMKKILVVFAFLSAFTFAQDNPWGVYAGYTSGSFTDADGRSSGLNLGISYDMNDTISVGAGMTHRGGKYNYTDEELGDGSVSIELKGKGVEFWMSYNLMSNQSFSLSAGPIYTHIYEVQAKALGLTMTDSESDNDYGFFVNGSVPINDKMAINLGYYQGLRELDDEFKFNNFWVELGYSF